MPSTVINNRTFDARPDRIDYRDRRYLPPLVSLPERFPDLEFIQEHLAQYTAGLILDQGSEGACTGFGLAAVINYLLWRQSLDVESDVKCVSPRMLYHPGPDVRRVAWRRLRGLQLPWGNEGLASSWRLRSRAVALPRRRGQSSLHPT